MIRILILLLMPCLSMAQPLEQELITVHDKQLREYMLNHNVEPLANISADDYFFVAAIGLLESRENVLKTAKNLKVEAFSISNDKVVVNEGTAVLSGVMEIQGTVMGHPLPKKMRYLSVFVKTPDGWKLQARSITPVFMPPTQRR